MSTGFGQSGLIASFYTLSGAPVNQPSRFSFRDRVTAAAAAGFTGIGLTVFDFEHLVAKGQSADELKSIVDDHGIEVAEVEFLNGWWAEGGRLAADRANEERIYDMADLFGAHHLNVGASVPPGSEPPVELMAERFAGICERASEHSLRVGLEYMPFFALADIDRAWEVVEKADRPNGGLVVDSFHHLRGPGGIETVGAVPADRVVAIQVGDAGADPGMPLLEESITARLWPGEGELDVVGLLAELARQGVEAPVGIEIVSTAVQALPVEDAARLAAESTRSVLARALGARA
jgi:sugar phosphate isomerase/epimerase